MVTKVYSDNIILLSPCLYTIDKQVVINLIDKFFECYMCRKCVIAGLPGVNKIPCMPAEIVFPSSYNRG